MTVGLAVAGRLTAEATPVTQPPALVPLTADASGPVPERAQSAVAAPQGVVSPPRWLARDPRFPASIACGPVNLSACRQLVRAGVVLLPEGRQTVHASVYTSLVCGDDFDCPRSLLRDAEPAGSVVLTLGDGSAAWVNVVSKLATGRIGRPTRTYLGLLVRWIPSDATTILGHGLAQRPHAE